MVIKLNRLFLMGERPRARVSGKREVLRNVRCHAAVKNSIIDTFPLQANLLSICLVANSRSARVRSMNTELLTPYATFCISTTHNSSGIPLQNDLFIYNLKRRFTQFNAQTKSTHPILYNTIHTA